MSNFDDLRLAVECITGGTNKVILDDTGMPSVMVAVPKMYSSDLIDGATQDVHPGFLVDAVEKKVAYASKYINIVKNNRAYSLPFQDPTVVINFDTALSVCRNKGTGWGLMPASLWAAIALWSKKNGTQPHGNNHYGSDITYSHEKGIETYESGDKTGRTATGSGPVTWNHDHTPAGICDANGGVWEWVAGKRLVNGEIQVITNANVMNAACSLASGSTEWKAIMPDGSLVDPGTDGTLHYDYVSSNIVLATSTTGTTDVATYKNFETLAAASGVSVPQIVKELALMPADTGYKDDGFWIDPVGERVAICGGDWTCSEASGIFATGLASLRSRADQMLGFRSAYYELT